MLDSKKILISICIIFFLLFLAVFIFFVVRTFLSKPKQAMIPQSYNSVSPLPRNSLSKLITITLTISSKGIFDPKSITVKQGQKLRIIFKPLSQSANLTISGYDIDTNIISPGKSVDINVITDRKGVFLYKSNLLHAEGKLIVQ